MPDYMKMYFHLFNQVTSAIAALQKAQQVTEELYLASKDSSIHLYDKAEENKEE